MFEQGSLIIYGSTGVCRVESAAPLEGARGLERNRLYYKLSPVYGSGTIYVPVDTKIYMRPILTRDEAMALIRRIPTIDSDFEDNGDWHAVAASYQACLQSHECEDLIHLIKSIYQKNQASAESRKRPYKVDQEYRKRAEDLLHSELAAALEIEVTDVPDFIAKELEKL